MVKEHINKLNQNKCLDINEWSYLLKNYNSNDVNYAAETAREISISKFGRNIFFRGIIEFSNICKNDCYYCGIRRSNKCVERYRLSKQDIIDCAKDGYACGFRTFVLQSGDDMYYSDDIMCDIVRSIKKELPDCAVTLSIGERTRESYQQLFDSGADRYLLRHEAASKSLYNKIHPGVQKYETRMECLKNLKDIGFQTGCGFMVGVPHQTLEDIAEDMFFMQNFKPQMIGIGPFIPHKDTPFGTYKAGNVELSLFLLSLTRILFPNILLPSTTALGTVKNNGRQLGVLAGCNVVMPNLSPESVRKKYMLYNNKIGTEFNAETGIRILSEQMAEIGYDVVISRGDYNAN